MRRLALPIALGVLAALDLAACGGAPPPAAPARAAGEGRFGRPQVAPLRYDGASQNVPSVDAPFRVSAPALGTDVVPDAPKVDSFALANGLRILVVERHGFPMVAARLAIATSAALENDVGGRRASLLGGVFLSPFEGVVQTSGGCDVTGCFVASRGLSGELPQVLSRVADLAVNPRPDAGVYEQRLAASARVFDASQSPARVTLNALLFGRTHRYGGPSPVSVPTLAELETLRDRAFVPAASTLMVVGDTTLEEVRAHVDSRLAGWTGPAPGPDPRPPEAPREGPRLVLWVSGAIVQVWGQIAARGPAPRDRDFPAVVVLSTLLGGKIDSAIFHHVREDMGAAYTLGSSIDHYADASILAIGGSFDRDQAVDGMRAVLAAIAAARDAEPSADDLARAKAAVLAEYRSAASTDEGLATLLAEGTLVGLGPQIVQERAALVASVTAADVRTAARRYLAPGALRAVLTGKLDYAPELQSLGLGNPVVIDLARYKAQQPL